MKLIHVLGLVPFLGMLGGLPYVNKPGAFVLGMPLNLFWIVLWVILTAVIMAIVYAIDPDNREEESS
ncbi:DUF3311 domain-containing protein [Brevibacillus brevis]|uniref:DUF3311 domain-containing protein n=1 Tax=Brevibacillus brevis TaxID=1393 RepID=A0ABY9SWC6_BREBE|nr:DUF3311 domain-containing protein [Brevibacillus brevis]WNC12120.1 DUF3311 domain-containing protein [Brevibacillus brevis]